MTLTQDILDHTQALGFAIAGIAPVGRAAARRSLR